MTAGRTNGRLGAVGVIVAAVGLVGLAGAPGVAATVIVAAAWYLLAPTYAFAIGQLAVVAFTSGGGVLGVAVAEAGLFGVLLAPAIRTSDPILPVVFTVWWTLIGGVLAWISSGVDAPVTPWFAGLVLFGATALAAYGVHRYQVVSLGSVDGRDTVAIDGGADQ